MESARTRLIEGATMSLTEQQKAELFDFLAQNTVSLTLVGYDGRHSVVEQKSSRTPETLAADRKSVV